MSSSIFFFSFVPLLAFILLAINFIFAPHNPYQEKNGAFECGFTSFLGQNRTQFSISFFIFALLFLLFDLEILLVYPYLVSSYYNESYGLIILLIFLAALTLGFVFELGKKALSIDSRQTIQDKNTHININAASCLPLGTPSIIISSLIINICNEIISRYGTTLLRLLSNNAYLYELCSYIKNQSYLVTLSMQHTLLCFVYFFIAFYIGQSADVLNEVLVKLIICWVTLEVGLNKKFKLSKPELYSIIEILLIVLNIASSVDLLVNIHNIWYFKGNTGSSGGNSGNGKGNSNTGGNNGGNGGGPNKTGPGRPENNHSDEDTDHREKRLTRNRLNNERRKRISHEKRLEKQRLLEERLERRKLKIERLEKERIEKEENSIRDIVKQRLEKEHSESEALKTKFYEKSHIEFIVNLNKMRIETETKLQQEGLEDKEKSELKSQIKHMLATLQAHKNPWLLKQHEQENAKREQELKEEIWYEIHIKSKLENPEVKKP